MSVTNRLLLRFSRRIIFYSPVNVQRVFASSFFVPPKTTFICPAVNEVNTITVRFKHKSKKAKEEVSSTEEEEETDILVDSFDEQLVDKNTKILDTKVKSLRADVILKAGLYIARNKIEEMFYQSRIRVNGKKIFKKSENVCEGDEIDIVKGQDPNNPLFLTVARVEILSVTPKGEGFSVKLRRCRTLTIENYEEDPWKP